MPKQIVADTHGAPARRMRMLPRAQVGTLNYMSPEAILGGTNNIRGGAPMKARLNPILMRKGSSCSRPDPRRLQQHHS